MKRAGFSIIEIMIVVGIIGLLAAIGIPSFITTRQRTQRNTCWNIIRQFESAKEQYAAENGLVQGSLISPPSVLNRYLANLSVDATCPGGGGSYLWIDYVGTAVTCPRHGKPAR